MYFWFIAAIEYRIKKSPEHHLIDTEIQMHCMFLNHSLCVCVFGYILNVKCQCHVRFNDTNTKNHFRWTEVQIYELPIFSAHSFSTHGDMVSSENSKQVKHVFCLPVYNSFMLSKLSGYMQCAVCSAVQVREQLTTAALV